VQRRRASQRSHNRLASPSPIPQHAALERWLAGLCRREAEELAGS
jgi:hypothetical protein